MAVGSCWAGSTLVWSVWDFGNGFLLVEMEQLGLLLLLLFLRLLPALPPATCPPLPARPWPALPQHSFAEPGTSSSITLVGLNNHPAVLLGALPSSSLTVIMHPDCTDTAVGLLQDPAPSMLPGSQTQHLDPKHSTWIPRALPGSQAHHLRSNTGCDPVAAASRPI